MNATPIAQDCLSPSRNIKKSIVKNERFSGLF